MARAALNDSTGRHTDELLAVLMAIARELDRRAAA
jgi:hypothetical protein